MFQKSMRMKYGIVSLLLALYYTILPFEYFMSSEMGTGLRYFAIVIVVVIILGLIIGKERIYIDHFVILMLLWAFYGLASYLWALSSDYWNLIYPIYLRQTLLLITVYFCRIKYVEFKMIINFYIISATVLALYIIFIASKTLIMQFEGRVAVLINGVIFDPNYTVAIMLAPMGYSFYYFLNKKWSSAFMRIIYLILFFTMVYASLLTGSRGGLLGILTIIGLTIFEKFMKEKNKIVILIVILLLVISYQTMISYLPDIVGDRFSFQSLTGQTDQGAGRLSIWVSSIEALTHRWLFGYGVGNVYYANYLYSGKFLGAHNLYLTTLLEFGLVGFSFLAGAFIFIIKKIKRMGYRQELYLIISMLVVCTFLDSLTAKYFWGLYMLFVIRTRLRDI